MFNSNYFETRQAHKGALEIESKARVLELKLALQNAEDKALASEHQVRKAHNPLIWVLLSLFGF